MRIRSRVATAVAAVVMGLAGAVVPTAPAAAAYPTCEVSYANGHAHDVPWAHYTWNCELRQGNTGQAVRALQWNLNRCYQAGLREDGRFGPLTRAALVNAQRAAGTAPDGIYGPNTRWALRWFSYDWDPCVPVWD